MENDLTRRDVGGGDDVATGSWAAVAVGRDWEPLRGFLGGEDALRIFVSHKDEDQAFARELKRRLAGFNNERVRVFISEEIPKGSEWYDVLIGALVSSDVLMLLYTDSELDWDYCMYEVGFFTSMKRLGPDGPSKTLLAFHDKEIEPPSPLLHVQRVEVSGTDDCRAELRDVMWRLFSREPRPGVRPVLREVGLSEFDQPLDGLADCIIEGLKAYSRPRHFSREIRIEVEQDALMARTDAKMPDSARVFGNFESMNTFRLAYRKEGYEWRKFLDGFDRASENTEDWVGSLVRLMREIAESPHLNTESGLPLYRVSGTGTHPVVYRPSIRSFQKTPSSLRFKVIFSDLPSETTTEPAGAHTTLAQAMWTGRMLLWGTLDPLGVSIEGAGTAPDPRATLVKEFESLFQRLNTTYTESRNRGYSRDALLKSIREEDRAQLDEVLAAWDGFRKQDGPEFLRHLQEDEFDPQRDLERAGHLVCDAKRAIRDILVLAARSYATALGDLRFPGS